MDSSIRWNDGRGTRVTRKAKDCAIPAESFLREDTCLNKSNNQFEASYSPSEREPELESLDIFQTEPAPTGMLSLETILNRHLAGHAAGTNAPPIDKQALQQFQSFYQLGRDESRLVGSQMNQVDIQTGKGLESYLPTPLTRFRVAKQRLTREIAAIETQLAQYEQAQQGDTELDATLATLVHAAKKRLWILKRHEQRVDLALNQMTQQFGLPQISDQTEAWQTQTDQWLSQIKNSFQWLSSNTSSSLKPQLQEVEILARLIEEQLAHPQPSAAVLSDLYLRYERAVRQMNKQALAIQEKPSFWKEVRGQIRKTLLK